MKRRFNSERFIKPTDLIDIQKLEKETQKLLFLGFIVAIAIHAAIGSYFLIKKTGIKVVKPLTMELVIRQPRMTKPFEFKKKRIEKREYAQKTISERIIPYADIKMKTLPDIPIGKIKVYEYTMEIKAEYSYIPERIDIDMSPMRKPSHYISMKEEMITIDDLDIGKYKGLVIQDPHNNQNIKGFIYIATLWGTHLEPAYKRAIIHLSEAVNKFTKIKSKVDEHLYIDSRKLFETPFVYLSVTEVFELTEIEARNFGEYLRNGGFAVLDNGTPQRDYAPSEASLRQMLRDSLGKDAVFIPIRNDYPLYHCFFDFDDGPPLGDENKVDILLPNSREAGRMSRRRMSEQKPVHYLEGIWIKDRLVAIYSDKGYCRIWADNIENEPQLKMGVNMLVFALIQEGGIAHKKIEVFTAVQ